MDGTTLNQAKRLRLLDILRQFRGRSDENEGEKSDLDALARKLEHGGMLDEVEIDRLLEVVAKTAEVSDREYHFYKRKLGRT